MLKILQLIEKKSRIFAPSSYAPAIVRSFVRFSSLLGQKASEHALAASFRILLVLIGLGCFVFGYCVVTLSPAFAEPASSTSASPSAAQANISPTVLSSAVTPSPAFTAPSTPAEAPVSPLNAVANIFDPHSVPAAQIHQVSLLVLWICAAIFVVVSVLLVYTIVKFRHRGVADDAEEPPQIYGSSQIELAWTVIPILITVVLILVTARTISEVQNAPLPENTLQIKVIGHQWWWEVHYPKQGIITANELHLPVSSGKTVQNSQNNPSGSNPPPIRTQILLESADVIHSFWVPQLAGKTDLIPNRCNQLWIEPLRLGTYLGNCAEYCGTQHANMLLRVQVDSPEEFEQWVKAQQQTPALPPPPSPTAAAEALATASTTPNGPNAFATRPIPAADTVALGAQLFFNNSCVNCHTIKGTPAQGIFGPDLTHLMSRSTLGAGVVKNTPQNLWQWIRDPQSPFMKPGCLMPDMKLMDHEVDQIVAYLETLK